MLEIVRALNNGDQVDEAYDKWVDEKKSEAGRATIDEVVCKVISDLGRCTFLPGSFDKRFVRDLQGKKPGDTLTLKQLMTLGQMRYRYRKQIEENKRRDL